MNDSPKARRRFWFRLAIISTIFAMVGLIVGSYIRSSHFASFLRARIVAQLENATGGRVEISELKWNLSKLDFDLRDVTIHGLESPDEIPFFHADRIYLGAKVGSLFHRSYGLRFLEIDRPVIHLLVYPDGSTNQPRPRGYKTDKSSIVQPIFDFSINKADFRSGVLLVNNRTMPLDFAAGDIVTSMNWFKAENRYEARIHVGKIDLNIEGARPFASSADAELSLWPGAADLKSLTIKSGRTHVEANAHLEDFRSPTLTVRYRANIDLADLGSILRQREMRGGELVFDGHGNYRSAKFEFAGNTTVRDAGWQEPWIFVKSADLSANYSIDNSTISMSRVSGHWLSGSVTGDAKVDGWCRPCTPRSGEQRGLVQLQLTGASVHELSSALSTRSLPLSTLNPVGSISGAVKIAWKGTVSESETQITASVAPPPYSNKGQLPISATMKGTYRSEAGILETSQFLLMTPDTNLTASGTLGQRTGNLRLFFQTKNLKQFEPLVVANTTLKELPVDIYGQLDFDGMLGGGLQNPSIVGRVELTNFDSRFGVLQNTSNSGVPPRMHWDKFSGEIEYSTRALALQRCTLERASTRLRFGGTAQLTKWNLDPTSPFVAKVAISNAQLSDIQSLTGHVYPISGTADLNMALSGTVNTPRGSGRILVRDATVGGENLRQIRSDITFVGKNIKLEEIEILPTRGRLTGTLAYDFGNAALDFNIRGTGILLQDIKAIQPKGTTVSGEIQLSAEGTGTPDLLSINADLNSADFAVGNEKTGRLNLQARTVAGVMNVNGGVLSQDGSLAVNGSVKMTGDFETNAIARFRHLNITPVWTTYSKGRLTGSPYATGDISVVGALRQWRNLQISGEISDLLLPVENMNIHNQGPLAFTLADRTLNLRQVHLAAEDTDLTASGTVEYAGERKLDLRAEGHVNLKIIQTMNPDFTSYGNATVNVRFAGTLDYPRTVGRIEIANAGLSYIDLPIGLSEINGSLVFNRDRLQVLNFGARTGGGTLNLGGYITYGRTIGLNLQATGNDIRLRYPQGISSIADLNLKLTGTPSSAVLGGDVVVTKFGITPQFDLANYIARSAQPLQAPKPNSLLYNLRLDVHVTSSTELQVQTSLGKVSGNVDLRLRGSAARPAVLGRVNIVEGEISFQGTKYHVERGDVTFSNPAGITPVLDIAATTRVRDYDISLGFHGSTDRLTTTYRSDPPLPTADIIALLAFGRTREESARQIASSKQLSEQASNVILGQALNATVSNRMQKLFGVSRIKIDPEVGGAENSTSSARVTIEQQVAKDLTITYITDLTRSNQQIISAEYNVTRAVSILAVRDQYGIVSFDVRIRHRKK